MRDLDMARVEPEEVAGPRVLLVEDHMLFGEAMRVAMAAAGLEVVAVVGTGPDALTAADVLRPDLALVDLHMADMDGIDLGRRMLERHPGMKLIMVTGYPDSTALQRAIEAKFQGFLSKDVSMREFVAAVRAVSEGHVVMPVNLASRIVGIRSDDERMAALNAKQLTPREWEILRLLVQGVSSG
ncbi:MAG TPA: response regulator transcription factor, partial [Actinomycetota bacterium]